MVILWFNRVLCLFMLFFFFFFFFQAEDCIRDGRVTGVQTCALPIYLYQAYQRWCQETGKDKPLATNSFSRQILAHGYLREHRTTGNTYLGLSLVSPRSEERRVGKECRSRWWPEH